MRHESLAPLFLLASATVALPNAHAAAGDMSIDLKGGITLETVSDYFEDVPGVSVEGLPAFGISGG